MTETQIAFDEEDVPAALERETQDGFGPGSEDDLPNGDAEVDGDEEETE